MARPEPALRELGRSPDAPAPADWRTERGRRTRERVTRAVIVLVEEGHNRPTGQAVADRAGVSLRTVYHHFDDMDSLRAFALSLEWNRRAAALVTSVTWPRRVDARIDLVVAELSAFFDTVAPVMRAQEALSASSAVSEALLQSRLLGRRMLELAFAREIAASGINAPVLIDAMDTALCWETWSYLRTELARTSEEAAAIFTMVLRNLLTDVGGRCK